MTKKQKTQFLELKVAMTCWIPQMYAAEPGELMAGLTLKKSATAAEVANLLKILNRDPMGAEFSVVGNRLEMRRSAITPIPFDHPARAALH